MADKYINIGGHKITTNKVGQVHTATLASGVTGTITWCVINGICFVAMSAVAATAGTTITTDIPKGKLSGIVANTGSSYIWLDGVEHKIFAGYGNLSNRNELISYPVADDWVES